MNPTGSLLDVFSRYDGNVLFARLVAGQGASASILGQIGWVFSAVGAFLLLWGHILRTGRQGSDRTGELARTLVVFAAMVGSPFVMRAAMEGADSLYDSTLGGPRNLTLACVKAAYAMPELNRLFDRVGVPPATPEEPSAADDSTHAGYLESFFLSMWDTAADYASRIRGTVVEAVRLASILAGFGAASVKVLLATLTLVPIYFLFLASAAIVWFMVQLRFLMAVVGTLMLPPFIGMLSLPSDHPNRVPAQRYLMNMLSLSMWPVAWTVGHTGTIVLFDALVGLIADGGRAPALQASLSWASVTSGVALTEAQVRAGEVALGNWFMGGVASELASLVGALGFAVWVLVVSVAGPLILHRVFAVGSLYATQALQTTVSASRTLAGVALTGQSAFAGAFAGPAAAAASVARERTFGADLSEMSVTDTRRRLTLDDVSGRMCPEDGSPS